LSFSAGFKTFEKSLASSKAASFLVLPYVVPIFPRWSHPRARSAEAAAVATHVFNREIVLLTSLFTRIS